MGREVKRVALDFDWPLAKTWWGFINPFCIQAIACPACEGSGSSAQARHLEDQWYGRAPFRPEDRGSTPFLFTDEHIVVRARRNVERAPEYYGSGESAVTHEARRLVALFNGSWCHHLNDADVAALIEANRLVDLTHVRTPDRGWQPKDSPYVPTALEVNIWSCFGTGHDSLNRMICVSAECKRLGYETLCPRCHGEKSLRRSESIEQLAEKFEPQPPPSGEGWQVWETVTEGSPVTPVFRTREALIDYLVEGGDVVDRKHGNGGWSRENAESFVAGEWAPSLTGSGGNLCAPRDGVTAKRNR